MIDCSCHTCINCGKMTYDSWKCPSCGRKYVPIDFLLNEVEKRNFTVSRDGEFENTKNSLVGSLLTRVGALKERKKSISENEYRDELFHELEKFNHEYTNVLHSVSDNLEEYLENEKGNVYFYFGINRFVLDYYKKNTQSKWKIRAVLQFGFPFDFGEVKDDDEVNKIKKEFLETKKWSLFVFTKEPFSKILLGFDDRYSFSNLKSIRQSLDRYNPDGKAIIAVDDYSYMDIRNLIADHLQEYLDNNTVPSFSNVEYEKLKYSFTEIPAECFRLDYLDYLSRYKKSVVDLFGYPDKNEKIKKLKNIARFENYAGNGYQAGELENFKVVVDKFFFQNGRFKPVVLISGCCNPDEYIFTGLNIFEVEYNIHPYGVSQYYLYCLLSSELISDYYSDRYDSETYNDWRSLLPIEDCIYLEMSPEKMKDNKYRVVYEQNINSKQQTHDMIDCHEFNNEKAKEAVKKFLVEIDNDIGAGAFYSATILMGSVLEAFLLDWLGEIDGKDYFREPLRVVNKDGHEQNASFKDYIRLMKEKCPRWTKGLETKADEIRTKRNRVHSKLYIEEGEISHDKCYEVLQDLKAIIKNRWNKL